jgi:peptide/nickel transport system substrate-binding protein
MRRREFLAASAATLALPAVARGEKSSVLKHIPFPVDPAVLDPVWGTSLVQHGIMVFDTLYAQTGPERGYAATPQMLAGHTVEADGKIWNLTLRDGLVFHDGTKVLARDCVASIKRWGVRDVLGQALIERIDELSAPDDRTIVFRLKKPFALLPIALGQFTGNPGTVCAIMPERLANTDPYEQVTEMIGSGPFRFKKDEWVQGSLRVYERFKDYKPREDGSPDGTSGPKVVHFDRVEWHVIPDPATAAAALRAGEMDWWAYPSPDFLPQLRQDSKVGIQSYPGGFCPYLRPNHLVPPFDNRAVRQALMGAVDQAEFMTAAFGPDRSLWQAPVGFFAPSSPLASEVGMAALSGPRDYAKVKKELEAAGYRGETVVFLASTQPFFKEWSAVAAEMMRKVGMNVDYQVMDLAAGLQRRASKKPPGEGGWSAYVGALTGVVSSSPATNSALRGNGEQAPLFGWPSSPKIEALRDQWLDATDLATQKKLAAEMQAQAFIDVPYYPLGINFNPTAFRSDLTGVLTASGTPLFWNVRRQA